MGLDVYLYRYDKPIDEIDRLEKEYEDASEKIWAQFGDVEYKLLTNEQKEKARAETKEVQGRLGLGDFGSHPAKVCVELPSQQHPDHYFKVGYFRSSYNASGFNRVVRNLGLPTLDEICGHDEDSEYVLSPDWLNTKRRALKAAEAIRAKAAEGNNFRAEHIGENIFGAQAGVRSEAEAIQIVIDEFSRHSQGGSDFTDYSNRQGNFYTKGLEIVAALPGIGSSFRNKGVYLVYRDTSLDWYAQGAEIVAETCDFVMGQANPQQFRLHWSS